MKNSDGVNSDRARLRALADAATRGPWKVQINDEDGDFPELELNAGSAIRDECGDHEHGSYMTCDQILTADLSYTPPEDDLRATQEVRNAEFIAATRTALPALLDHIDKLESSLQRARGVLDQANLRPGTEEHELARRIRRALDDDRGEPAR